MLSIYSSTKQNSYWLNSRAQCSAQGWYSDKRGGKCWWFVKAVRLSASSAKIGCNNEKNGGVITKSRSQLRGGPSLLSQNSHLSQAMPDQLFYNRLFTVRCKHAFKDNGLMIICQNRCCRHEVLHHDCAATNKHLIFEMVIQPFTFPFESDAVASVIWSAMRRVGKGI